MKKLFLLAFALPSLAVAQPTASNDAAALRDAALNGDTVAWEFAEGLTTEVGQRLAGTEAEARGREWAMRRLRDLGFANVHEEPFELEVWVRGEERAEIVTPFPQSLTVTALGGSGATPARGLEAAVVGFQSLGALEAAPDAMVRGKIVFIDHDMRRAQDGSGYGAFGPARFRGPGVAARKGAVGVVIRSAGTDYHRNPHTGGTGFPEGVRAIPAGALSIPDAEQLERILARAGERPVRMRLTLTPRNLGRRASGNVVAEVPGSDPSAGVIVIGGHLDSWDLGTGAFDNAAGVAITTAAAHRIMQAGRPRRTIRVVLFGAEEVGVFGGNAYFERHQSDGNVVLVGESDFGADRVWRAGFSLAAADTALADRVMTALAPLGIARGRDPANAGADLGAWVRAGAAAIDLNQDGTRYFDYHHTPDDTLDKIDPAQLRQNVAAWTAMLAVAANWPGPIGRTEPRPAR